MENIIKYGTLQRDGTLTNVRFLNQSSIAKCPFYIFDITHYREDGTCKCNDPEHQKFMIKNWGYKKSSFKKVGK